LKNLGRFLASATHCLLTIQGSGASQLAVSGGNASRVFEVDGANMIVTLSGLTITQGDGLGGTLAGYGGGIYNNYGTVTMSGCTLSGNSADFGGAVYTAGLVVKKKVVAELTMTGCLVEVLDPRGDNHCNPVTTS